MTNYGDNDGRVFGDRYEIRRKIARGGMADVYLAQDKLLDRPVALKVLFPELSVDPSFVERFRREAQNAAKLSHPNVVSVYDWGEDASTYYIVMEFVDGRSLSQILREDGALSAQRAGKIGAEVASALSFAHRNGVIHRDVKPGNVLIDPSGLVKVTDFGIARARNTTENLTQTGAVMGTATYFSPEQAQGQAVDERSDVYSLGVVLYEMTAGKPPFQGDNPVTIAYKHVREAPTPLRELNRSIPVEYEAITAKAMAKSPDSRYPSAEALRADLQRFERGQTIDARVVPPTRAMPARSLEEAYADSTRTIPAVRPETMPARPAMPTPKERSLAGPVMLLLSLIAIVAIALVVIFSMGGSSSANKAVTVPGVVGQNKDDAASALKRLKLQVTETQQANSAAKDTVISQNPAANTAAHQNDVVQLTVSTGPAPVSLDDYTGQSADSAKNALQTLGLKVQETQAANDTVAANSVISQDPASGTSVAAGSTVTLTVSSGPEQVQVPNLVGFTMSTAAQALSDAGLRTSEPANADPSDLVASSDPVAGTQVAKGATVVLTAQATTTSSSSTSSTSSTSTSTTSTTVKK